MLELLAQTYNTLEGYEPITTTTGGGLALFSGAMLMISLIVLPILIIEIVALWKIFEKAGVEGWKAIIPIYNSWTLAEIAGKPGWWGLAPLVYLIPIIGWMFGWIVVLIFYVIIALELAKKFGKDTTFAVVWLIIFSIVGILILGFGDAKYEGKVARVTTKANDSEAKPLGKPRAPKS